MATLKQIRKRISAVKSTKKLTRAMRMIAALRLRKAQGRVLEARLFNSEITRLLSELIKRDAVFKHPLVTEQTDKKEITDVIVFSSDRGLCGTFNEGLLSTVKDYITQKRRLGEKVCCFVFGKKGRDFFRMHNLPFEKEFIHVSEANAEMILNAEIAMCRERFLSGATDKVVIVFNKFKGVGSFEPVIKRVIPATPPDLEPEYCIDYIYEPSRAGVLNWLVMQMIRSNIYQAYLESSAAEIAARMVAMDKATRNAEELIDGLTMQFNRARQSSITKELIDIVGGAEALL